MKSYRTHLISCLLAEIQRRSIFASKPEPIRILDAGCGGGELISELVDIHRERNECAHQFEIYGFVTPECSSARLPTREKVVESLADRHAHIDWNERISYVSEDDHWPYENRFFDYSLSSQVLEYDSDLGWFFEQRYRVLGKSGVGIHHFTTNRRFAGRLVGECSLDSSFPASCLLYTSPSPRD